MSAVRPFARWIRLAALGCATFALAVAAAIAVWVMLPLPAGVLDAESASGMTIEDRSGIRLRSTRAPGGSDAQWLPYDQVDPDLINAFVAVEDRRFWEHRGVDPLAVLRAARDNAASRRVVSGASTITMQLARLLMPAKRSWATKAREAVWALRLEAHLGKQQIMEQYLNRVHLGQGSVGVAAASALYFGAAASDLSVGQAAALAGLAHAPSRDNPHVSPSRARARRDVALERMRRAGFVLGDDVARAREEPLVKGSRTAPFLAPHFTTRVIAWSADDPATSSAVKTTLDAALQEEIEAEVRHTVENLRDRGVLHAAVVVLDNASGEVLAWVGSPDFWSSDDGQTDMVVSRRQPGSALKPFLYAMALDRGYTAATVLPDIPKSYATATGAYSPRNYDRRFRGPVRLREALASSYNVPAVELAEKLGTASLLHTLHLAGFESLSRDAEYYGLGLALGNGDVTLIEMANGYRALANGGVWSPWTWHAGAGATAAGARQVVSPGASAIVLDILQDPVARTPGFGPTTPFDFPFPVAVKTGTSRHFTDNWAVGVTRGFTVAVWAGNFSGSPMQGVSGVSGAGPLLHRAVMAASRRYPPGVLTTPREVGAVPVEVCRLSGLRASPECAGMVDWFLPGTEPRVDDYWERDGRIALPDEYAEWALAGLGDPTARTLASAGAYTVETAVGGDAAGKRAVFAGGTGASDRSRGGAKQSAEEGEGKFRIISPRDGDRYSIPPGMDSRYATIPLRTGGPGSGDVRWTIDGKPFEGSRWRLQPGEHVIEAAGEGGAMASAKITVTR